MCKNIWLHRRHELHRQRRRRHQRNRIQYQCFFYCRNGHYKNIKVVYKLKIVFSVPHDKLTKSEIRQMSYGKPKGHIIGYK